jgi:hypothetical protein
VPNANVARQTKHVSLPEYIANQPIALALMQTVCTPRYSPGSILSAVLHDSQRIKKRLIDWLLTDDSNKATHDVLRDSGPGRGQ